MAIHYADAAATQYGGEGIANIIKRSDVEGNIMDPHYTQLPDDIEVGIDLPPSSVPVTKTLPLEDARSTLKTVTGEAVPRKFRTQSRLDTLLQDRIDNKLNKEQIDAFNNEVIK